MSEPTESPSATSGRVLVVGLGNDLLADDAIGIVAARELQIRLDGRADVVATLLHGVALLDVLIGYDRVIVIDAIQTNQQPVGTLLEIDAASLRPVASPSPHYTGLPELLELAERLGLQFPRTVRIFAVEAADLLTIGGEMSEPVRGALPELCLRVERALDEFEA